MSLAVIPGEPKAREGDPEAPGAVLLDPLPLRFAPAGDDRASLEKRARTHRERERAP